MQDYYELLEIDRSLTCEEIGKYLLKLNKKYRVRTNQSNDALREEAVGMLALVGEAMAHLGDETKRSAYDLSLSQYRAEQELLQPMSDVDIYDALALDMTMKDDALRQYLEDELSTQEEQAGEIVERRRMLLLLAQRILLDPQKRAEYDEQLTKRREFSAQRDAAKPVPLRVNGAVVETWADLESSLDAHHKLGLDLLCNGEIEAWVRWSLGEKQRADYIHDIALRAGGSSTPYMEYQELLRMVNRNRPLLLCPQGEGPESNEAVPIGREDEIPGLADQYWSLFIEQMDYVIDWLGEYGSTSTVERLERFARVQDRNIVLERIVAAIAPDTPSPHPQLTGISRNHIDFGTVNSWATPTHTFEIHQQGRGYLYGAIRSDNDWLSVEPETFTGQRTMITVTADRNKMTSGADNQGELHLSAMDGRVESIRVTVSASQKTLWKSVTGIFGRGG